MEQVWPSPGSINVFISSVPPREKALRRSLITALSPLVRQALITLWSDENVLGGQQSEQEITHHLNAAQLILLLVSPDCIDSRFWNQQMAVIMAREAHGDVQVIPVLLRPTVGWQDAPFGHLPTLPADGKPVVAYRPRDEGWYEIARSIHRLVAHVQQVPPAIISRRLRTQPPVPHPSASVPRPQLVVDIYQQLTSPTTSALVLTGIGGLGKSVLAIQVCHFVEEQRRAGHGPFLSPALWLDIDATTSLQEVLITLCEASGAALPALQTMSVYDLVAALLQLVQNNPQPRLIIINQLEHWLDPQTRYPLAQHAGVGEWLELLNTQPCASRILFTSRIYPHGKQQHLDAYVQRFVPAGLTVAEGLQLFRLGNIAETDQDLAAVVASYQGHPLALALLRDILKENRSLSLATLLQDLAYKQLWVNDMAENILQYIYTQQLNQEQRELLQAFAIYRLAVPLQAAQSIVHRRITMPVSRTGAVLRVLLDQDLLQATGNLEYRLQPVLRDFVQAWENENDPGLDAEKRRQVHQIAASYYQERFSDATRRMSQPHINDFRLILEAAWHYCQADQPAEAYQLIHREQLFLYFHRWGGNSLLLELYELLLPAEKWHAAPLTAGQVNHEMGSIQSALGNKHEAQLYYERALPLLRQAEQPVVLAEALNDLGMVYRALNQEALAEQCYREAWVLCEEAGKHFPQRGITLNNMGRLLYERGRQHQQRRQKAQARELFQEALARYEQALAAHQSNNQPEERGWTLLNLGDVYMALNQHEKAHNNYWQALQQFRGFGERRGEGTVLNNLGVLLAYDRAKKDQALACYVQAIHIFRAVGDRWQEEKTLRNLGRWLLIYVPEQEPSRTQGYISGLACFFAARAVFKKQHTTRDTFIPDWLLASLRQELGAQKVEELVKDAETRSSQIVGELLHMPHDFV
ncbi:hypothetical protein KDAU_54480 [Dictyobacter aurantiacus]|uniref:TIR domain-containing protein n=2 Tax=Dictyobacter aurantiacus TaxID=1936993 RepID=A0A401ZMM8_9CHLR|nr:hypothetical protein KDAU_54480 [Dictyobacter aurantiacus]